MRPFRRLVRSVLQIVAAVLVGLVGALVVLQFWFLFQTPLHGASAPLTECGVQLRDLGPVLQRFRTAEGRWPRTAEELYPRYVSDLQALQCPLGRTLEVRVIGPDTAVLRPNEGYYTYWQYEQPLLLRRVLRGYESIPVLWPDGRVTFELGTHKDTYVVPIWDLLRW